ncbi:hypothetical protein HanXRQr2_Chr05g0220781 [Helianthus annuus]|uniref:Uncharacterized protein n=1 Tax=Helianthus annuus TaxID=4232 RepID=A0A9K3J0N9_HELAN|nr:hypothetical protein HanXRQr2_Chr05g0220781 [Helianthus annuus]
MVISAGKSSTSLEASDATVWKYLRSSLASLDGPAMSHVPSFLQPTSLSLTSDSTPFKHFSTSKQFRIQNEETRR